MKDLKDVLKNSSFKTKQKFWIYIISTFVDMIFMFGSFYYMINGAMLIISVPMFIIYLVRTYALYIMFDAYKEIKKGFKNLD